MLRVVGWGVNQVINFAIFAINCKFGHFVLQLLLGILFNVIIINYVHFFVFNNYFCPTVFVFIMSTE